MQGIHFIGIALLLGSCMLHAPTIGEPDETGSGSSVMTQTGADADAPNEATPETMDSLEVAPEDQAKVMTGTLTPDDTIMFGANDPPLMQEFFDYDCPYCREYTLETRPWIDAKYVATGKLRVERLFAPQTAWGRRLALAALCAADQGKFDATDALLVRDFPANETLLLAIVKRVGLQRKTYDTCMKQSNRIPKEITGKRVPALLIGGTLWEGIPEESELRRILDQVTK